MKKIIILLITLALSIIIFAILVNPADFFLNITATLEVWLYRVYPSVFTFYIISSFLINTNIISRVIYYLRAIFKHLRFKNEQTLNLFILSMFIGNPSSAGLITEELNKASLEKRDANNLLKYAGFMNPLFIISFLSAYKLSYSLLVITSHILANVLIALFCNLKNPVTLISRKVIKFNLSDIFDSLNNVIKILLIVSSAMVLSNILKYSIDVVLNHFNLNSLFATLVLSNLEVSSGITSIMSLGFDIKEMLIMFVFLVSFAGISIHLQVLNIISDANLSYKSFFKYRIIQAVISVLLLLSLYGLFIKS